MLLIAQARRTWVAELSVNWPSPKQTYFQFVARTMLVVNHQEDTRAVKDSLAVFQTSHGIELRGNLLRFTRHQVVMEIYNPSAVLQTSEVLGDFRSPVRAFFE